MPTRTARALTLLAAASTLAATIAAGPASTGRPGDYELVLTLGESGTVEGEPVAGANPGHLAGTDGTYPCGDTDAQMCRSILVEVTNPFGDDATKGRERATLSLQLSGEGVGDAAIMVYESDADGTHGSQVASGDELGTLADESTEVVVTTTQDEETRWFVVEVFFHAWVGTWTMDATFS